MAQKSNATGNNVAEIEQEIRQLVRDLETRVGHLNSLTRRGMSHATNGARDYVSDALDQVSETLAATAEQLRGGAAEAAERLSEGARGIGNEAARLSQDALRKVEDEVSQRPLLTLAIAAGIGFLAGTAGRRR